MRTCLVLENLWISDWIMYVIVVGDLGPVYVVFVERTPVSVNLIVAVSQVEAHRGVG